MSTERVLRVRRVDEDGNTFVLIKVTSSGSRPLDVQLVGTEGENPYVVTIKETSIRNLRASNYQGTDEQWEALLKHVLLQHPSSASSPAPFEGVESVAAVETGRLTLTIRKNISGITQRLGSIQLSQNDEQEIELFDWTGIAAQADTTAQDAAAQAQKRLEQQQEQVTKLTAQLDDLIRAKQEHEDELLQKFTELLNSKKLKIREQQRLLSTVQVPARAGASGGRIARKNKRKANGKAQAEESESEDGFAPAPANAMDVDIKEEEDDEDERGPARETPEPTDTEDEDDLDAGIRPTTGQVPLSSSPAPEASHTLRSSHTDPEEAAQEAAPKTNHSLRSQPAEAPKKVTPTPPVNDDDTETEDDEL